MKKIKVSLQMVSCFFLCLFLVIGLLPVSVMAVDCESEDTVKEETESKVVRVGWYEDSYHITGANGERSGYGYEYEQTIAAYTGWKYEYVKDDWAELLEMLQNGEIDMMGALSYTNERAETMLFSELPMGEEKYYLYADLTNTDISASNLSTLNNKRILAMEESVQATQFYEWEKKHNVKTQHINVDSVEQAKEMVKNHKMDGIISTETPIWVEIGMSAIVTTGGSDIYYGISKERSDLKEELDNAMRSMEYDKPFYSDELHKRYLSAVASPVLSNEEKEWVRQHGKIRVGYLNHDSGVSNVDAESDMPMGVLNDYINLASNCLGNQTLDFELVGFESQEEQLQALQDNKIDMIFHFGQNPYTAEQNELSLSNTVLAFNMAAVTTEDYFDENAENRVAIEKGNLLYQWYVSYNYPKWNIVECDSIEEVEKVVRGGKADCFIAESGQLTNYIQDHKLHSVFLTFPGNTSFAVKRENTLLLSILNKTLKTMSSSMLTGALAMYENALRKVTVIDFIKDNLLIVTTMFLCVFAFILVVILGFLRKARMAEGKARQAANQSLELNKRLKESHQELETALLRAESANSAKTTFLNNMSHDIRTPMNAIIGFTALAASHIDNKEKVKEYLSKISTSGEHLLSLINDILDMSRIESGKVKINENPLYLPDLLHDIQTIVQPNIASKQLEFLIDMKDVRDDGIIADKLRLTQVLLNILSNAIKFNKTGGTVSLVVKQLKSAPEGYGSYQFIIRDTGIGMKSEFQEHIFESFTREETSTVSGIQGTGLGMAITKNIVDMMGGTISVKSEERQGSEFVVNLTFKLFCGKSLLSSQARDLISDSIPKESTLEKKRYELNGKRILLVEDNVLNMEIAQTVLQEAGFVIDTANDGVEAVEKMKQAVPGQYDLILMDIQMPILNGYEAAKQIRALKNPEIASVPIVAMTANAFEEDREKSYAAGMNGHLAKPVSVEKLLDMIYKVIKR